MFGRCLSAARCGAWSLARQSTRPAASAASRLASDGRIHARDPAQPVGLAVEQRVMRRHLTRQVHAAPPPALDHRQPRGARHVQHVAGRARFEQQPAEMIDRGDFRLDRPRLEVGERIGPARRLQRGLGRGDDRAILGVECHPQPNRTGSHQRRTQAAVVGRRQPARSRPQKDLQSDHQPRVGQLTDRIGRRSDQPQDAEVAVGGGIGKGLLDPSALDRVGRRHRVGHVEHRRHAAHHRRARAAGPVLLVLEPR